MLPPLKGCSPCDGSFYIWNIANFYELHLHIHMHAARMLYLPLIANNTNEFISSKTSHFSLNVNLKTNKQFLTVSFAVASSRNARLPGLAQRGMVHAF